MMDDDDNDDCLSVMWWLMVVSLGGSCFAVWNDFVGHLRPKKKTFYKLVKSFKAKSN